MFKSKVTQTVAASLFLGLGATMAVQAQGSTSTSRSGKGFGISQPDNRFGKPAGDREEKKICFIESCKKPGGGGVKLPVKDKPDQPITSGGGKLPVKKPGGEGDQRVCIAIFPPPPGCR